MTPGVATTVMCLTLMTLARAAARPMNVALSQPSNLPSLAYA